MTVYFYVWLCRAMYGYVGLCMSVYVCVGLCRAMLGYVGLCKAIGRNLFHILANGDPLYDAYTTYLPALSISPLATLSPQIGQVSCSEVLRTSWRGKVTIP